MFIIKNISETAKINEHAFQEVEATADRQIDL